MLHDLFLIEAYYGAPESAQALEDLVRRYGAATVKSALRAGDLTGGYNRLWLTDKGRSRALHS